MRGHFRHTPDRVGYSFTEPDLFDNSVPFDNITAIYVINLLWKLIRDRIRVGLRV